MFKNIVGTPPRIHIRKPDKRTGKVYSTIAFKSLRVEALNQYYDLFYVFNSLGKRQKVVPKNISELLTDRALAFWIMDDGGINAYKATHLNTDGFSMEDIQRLQEALMYNFQLKTRIANKRPGQWIIVIPATYVPSYDAPDNSPSYNCRAIYA